MGLFLTFMTQSLVGWTQDLPAVPGNAELGLPYW